MRTAASTPIPTGASAAGRCSGGLPGYHPQVDGGDRGQVELTERTESRSASHVGDRREVVTHGREAGIRHTRERRVIHPDEADVLGDPPSSKAGRGEQGDRDVIVVAGDPVSRLESIER